MNQRVTRTIRENSSNHPSRGSYICYQNIEEGSKSLFASLSSREYHDGDTILSWAIDHIYTTRVTKNLQRRTLNMLGKLAAIITNSFLVPSKTPKSYPA